MSRRRKPNSRNPALRLFLMDQGAAAAAVVARRVVEVAGRTHGRHATANFEDLEATDPLGAWFVRAYLGFLVLGHHECPHLSTHAPQPQRWDSAAPDSLWCEARCAGPGLDLQLRAHGYLPARCGRCNNAAATHHVDIALAETRIVGRVCAGCMVAHSPDGGDAA